MFVVFLNQHGYNAHFLAIFMSMANISIRGARTHNLKNLNVDLPRDQLIVITGLSGSGKSSLAFDTLYAEGQRRYVESLSAYARQFLSMMEKPDVDHIEGLSPAISIEQKSTSRNPRSTVGTITEIYDYLRLLYAKVGQPQCPVHHHTLEAQSISQMVDAVLAMPIDTKVMILAPVIRERKGEHVELLQTLRAQGFIRARIDGEMRELDQLPKLDLRKKHTIEVVVDRLKVRDEMRVRLAESFETALRLAEGIACVGWMDEPRRALQVFSAKFACPDCGYSLSELSPRLFSFNSPQGACGYCDGLGTKEIFDPKLIVNGALSLSEGAIRGWDKRNTYYHQLLSSLAKHYSFSLETPFEKLPKKIQSLLLYGGEDIIRFKYKNGDGSTYTKNSAFEGLGDDMGSQEQALVQKPVVGEQSSQFGADAGGGQPVGSEFNKIFPADDIAAGWSDAAARILDKRAGGYIGAHRGGFQRFHKLAIAVVHEADAAGTDLLDPFAQHLDIGDG